MRRTSSALLVASLLTAGLSAQNLPEVRWQHAAEAAAPWVPQEVHWVGRDQFVWSQVGGANPARELLAVDGAVARFEVDISGAAALSRSAAGARPDRLYALDAGAPGGGSTLNGAVRAYDPWSANGAQSMPAVWVHSLGTAFAGGAQLVCDPAGERVVVAIGTATGVQVDQLAGQDGLLLSRCFLPGTSVQSLAVSADGSTVAVGAGAHVWVLDDQGVLRFGQALAASAAELSLSADGGRLALATLGGTQVLERVGTGYQLLQQIASQGVWPGASLSARLQLSADGARLAVAHWYYTSNNVASFEVWQLDGLQRLWHEEQWAPAGSLQNLPVAARITGDGQRAAFASWGNGVHDEVVWVDLGDNNRERRVNIAGSAMGLDLSDDGGQLAIASKAVHAQVASALGSVQVLQMADWNLRQQSAARPGQALSVRAHNPGGYFALFLVGPEAPAVTVGGVAGLLQVNRAQLSVSAAALNAAGEADWSVVLPAGTMGPELPFALQVAFRDGSGTWIAPELLRPLVLAQ
ncbi:MAG: hypothetical protein R3E96_00570 [Planctomycetota bacterium]